MGDEWLGVGLDRVAWDLFGRYDNFNVLLNRSDAFAYEQAGRNQTSEQAMMLDNVIDNLFHTAILDEEDFSLELKSTAQSPHEIYAWLMDSEGVPYGAN
jgi:hypothetical protein